MNKRLIIHIGTYKTGTSYLQSVFGLNRKLLKKQGIFYPSGEYFNHSINFYPLFSPEEKPNAFTVAKMGDISKQEMIDICEKYWLSEFQAFKKSSCHTFIISAELLCILAKENVEQIKKFVEPHFDEINIICYAREPKSLLMSIAQEMPKNGYIRLEGVKGLIYDTVDIEQIIKGYIHAFGEQNVFVRPFVKERMKNNDLVSDFADTVWPGKTIELCLKTNNQNKSLGHYSALFFSEFNKIYPLHDENGDVNIGRKPMMFFQDIQQKYDKKIDIELPFSDELAKMYNQRYAFVDRCIDDGHTFQKITANNMEDISYETKDIPLDFLIHIIKEYEDIVANQYDIGVKKFVKQKIAKYKNILLKRNNKITKINV